MRDRLGRVTREFGVLRLRRSIDNAKIGGEMNRGLSLTRRRSLFGAVLLAAAITAVLAVVVPAAATSAGGNRLDAKVLATNAGPLPACSDNCGPASTVRYYIRIENGNALTNTPFPTRAEVVNSFVVNSIAEATFVDGVQDHDFDIVWTPPPNPNYQPYSGHWLVTANCPPEGPPCTIVGSPAVLPQEEASVFYTGWAHGVGEPNGTYVFKFTIHGTLNGTPKDLTVSSPPIVMTA